MKKARDEALQYLQEDSFFRLAEISEEGRSIVLVAPYNDTYANLELVFEPPRKGLVAEPSLGLLTPHFEVDASTDPLLRLVLNSCPPVTSARSLLEFVKVRCRLIPSRTTNYYYYYYYTPF